jgi:hypothetical protein
VPESVVTELVHAGLSRSTVLAMEPWKAQEVLDLLHSAHAGEGQHRAPGWGARAPRSGAVSPPPGPLLGFSTQD